MLLLLLLAKVLGTIGMALLLILLDHGDFSLNASDGVCDDAPGLHISVHAPR